MRSREHDPCWKTSLGGSRVGLVSGYVESVRTVRKVSIANINLSCESLTCPALERRHAGPWARKMSAISSLSRGTAPPDHSILRFLV